MHLLGPVSWWRWRRRKGRFQLGEYAAITDHLRSKCYREIKIDSDKPANNADKTKEGIQKHQTEDAAKICFASPEAEFHSVQSGHLSICNQGIREHEKYFNQNAHGHD